MITILDTCPCSGTNEKKEMLQVVLNFYRQELLDDIANYSWVISDVSKDDSAKVNQQIADIVQDGNRDRVIRVLGLAHQECINILYAYTKQDVISGEEFEDYLKDETNYPILMSVPTTFSRTNLNYLEHLIHEYLICRVIEDWLSIVSPDKRVVWLEKLEDIKTKIEEILNQRVGRKRRPMNPF